MEVGLDLVGLVEGSHVTCSYGTSTPGTVASRTPVDVEDLADMRRLVR